MNLVLSNKPKRKSIYGEPHPLRKFIVDPRDNDDFDEDRTDGFSLSFPFWGGKRRKRKTRKKRGGWHIDNDGYIVRYEEKQLVGEDGRSLRQQEYYIFIKDDEYEGYKWMTYDNYMKKKMEIDRKKREFLVNDGGINPQQMMNTLDKNDDVEDETNYDIYMAKLKEEQ